jgi:hypothetical protein
VALTISILLSFYVLVGGVFALGFIRQGMAEVFDNRLELALGILLVLFCWFPGLIMWVMEQGEDGR